MTDSRPRGAGVAAAPRPSHELTKDSTMKLTVFGATGPTGREVVAQALERGHQVTAVARRPEDLGPARPGLSVVRADVTAPAAELAESITGADAVLSALGARGRHPTTVYSQGTKGIAEAMAARGVSRLICISSDGIEVPEGLGLPQRLVMSQVIQRLYRHQYADMTRMEAYLADSPLDWTIVRAPRLTDGPALAATRISLDLPILDATGLRRADLAAWMLDAVALPETVRRRAHLAQARSRGTR
jgi:putative NADH-flavin reductase